MLKLHKDRWGHFEITGLRTNKKVYVCTNWHYVFFRNEDSAESYQPTYSGGSTLQYDYRDSNGDEENNKNLEKSLNAYIKYSNSE